MTVDFSRYIVIDFEANIGHIKILKLQTPNHYFLFRDTLINFGPFESSLKVVCQFLQVGKMYIEIIIIANIKPLILHYKQAELFTFIIP